MFKKRNVDYLELPCEYLNTRRVIRVLKPLNYNIRKKYPVLYIHDGQNLLSFDHTSISGKSWEIDKHLKHCIIVCIDNLEQKRINEFIPFTLNYNVLKFYAHYSNASSEKMYGDAYADFVVKQLKPIIDKQYSTLSDFENTFIVGSSLGAVISLYIVSKYPNIFSGIGLFSIASHFLNKDYFDYILSKQLNNDSKYYLSVGTKEGFSDDLLSNAYLNNFNDIFKILTSKELNVYSKIFPGAVHNEHEWKKQFKCFMKFVMLK